MYSELIKVPLASGKVTFATFKAGPSTQKAQIYEMTAKVDLRGKVNKILMLSIAGGPPSLVGIDNLCK